MNIFIVLGVVAIIGGNISFYFYEKRNSKRIDELDERLSVLDGGSYLLKKYVNHCNEVRILDLKSRLSSLEQLGLIVMCQNTESEDTEQTTR